MNACACTKPVLHEGVVVKLSRIAFLAGLLVIWTVLIGQTIAFACPPGTVFSAYKGNGLCLFKGRGKSVAARCTTINGPCPKDMIRKKRTAIPTISIAAHRRLSTCRIATIDVLRS
jgi:hypothetical protein